MMLMGKEGEDGVAIGEASLSTPGKHEHIYWMIIIKRHLILQFEVRCGNVTFSPWSEVSERGKFTNLLEETTDLSPVS